jgi:hypothetical protein
MNCPLGANTTTELKNITTFDNNSNYWGMFRVTSVPVLSDELVIFLSSIVVLIPNGNFWVVPL